MIFCHSDTGEFGLEACRERRIVIAHHSNLIRGHALLLHRNDPRDKGIPAFLSVRTNDHGYIHFAISNSLMHFHLTFAGLVCLLSLWEAAGAMSFHDPFEGTETNIQSAHFGINEASDEE